jgi:hypothetical protein
MIPGHPPCTLHCSHRDADVKLICGNEGRGALSCAPPLTRSERLQEREQSVAGTEATERRVHRRDLSQRFLLHGEIRMPGGEAEVVHRGGGHYVSVIGSNALFHNPEDRDAKVVDAASSHASSMRLRRSQRRSPPRSTGSLRIMP